MKIRQIKALATMGALAGAIGLTAVGAGTASAATIHYIPRQNMPFSTLGKCLTYGNTAAQEGELHTYTCKKQKDGSYLFRWS